MTDSRSLQSPPQTSCYRGTVGSGVLFFLAAAVFVAMGGSVAMGQPADESAEEDGTQRQARELFLRGDRLYAEGRYEESVEAFRQSYELSGRPELLFNLANAYERLGRLEEALAALRQYAPYTPTYDRETIDSRIQSIQDRIHEAERQVRTGTGSHAAPGSGVDPAPSLIGPIVLLGTGGAAAAAATVFAVMAGSAGSDAEAGCNDDGLCRASAQGDLDDEATFATLADVSGAVAATLLAGGVVWMIGALSGEDSEQADTARIAPMFSPQSAGLQSTVVF